MMIMLVMILLMLAMPLKDAIFDFTFDSLCDEKKVR